MKAFLESYQTQDKPACSRSYPIVKLSFYVLQTAPVHCLGTTATQVDLLKYDLCNVGLNGCSLSNLQHPFILEKNVIAFLAGYATAQNLSVTVRKTSSHFHLCFVAHRLKTTEVSQSMKLSSVMSLSGDSLALIFRADVQ